jgi:hypothetical protein
MYKENPKTKGSGIVCAIPQTGTCPNKCEDCFFQSGRSYLEPLNENLPNLPSDVNNRVVRVNDGNDSNFRQDFVIACSEIYPMKFYNTSISKNLEKFDAPVVLTINPGKITDTNFHRLNDIPPNLMFVRFRVNMWNLELLDEAIDWYSDNSVPVILTFMAYFKESIPRQWKFAYTFRKRTLNSYWAITTGAWEKIMFIYRYNKWVYSCGKIEGEKGTTACRHCGNCLREYFATMERTRREK